MGLETKHRPTYKRADGAVFSHGVSDGTRTRDIQDHNLTLYQLNYTHHGCVPTAGLHEQRL